MKKITKKLLLSYVFDNNFNPIGLTWEQLQDMYNAVQYAENHPNELTNAGIKKSHKMHYSNADKKAFVQIVHNNL